MKDKILILVFCIVSLSCSNRSYFTEETENPAFKPNTVFKSSEDMSSPKFEHLITKYRLDTIFHGETDEFKRILLLRQWIKSIIAINDFGDPYPGKGFAEGILDAAIKGQGFHCGHYMTVQNGIMNAFGYVTRTLGAGPGGTEGADGHHGINEIWLNQYNKWFLSDAKYDHHFEKNGIPLSALEVRNEYLKNKAADIVRVKGPKRIPSDVDSETGINKEHFARTYTWIEWHGYNEMFISWPDHKEFLIMYEDDYSRHNKWIWDKKEHWAFSQPDFMKMIPDENAIYWTPNTIESKTTIESNVAKIELNSELPNLKNYEMKELPSGEWKKVDRSFDYELIDKEHELLFRAVNVANVAGPEHKILIRSR